MAGVPENERTPLGLQGSRESPCGSLLLLHSFSIRAACLPHDQDVLGAGLVGPSGQRLRGKEGERVYLKALHPPGRRERDTEPEVPRGPRVLPRSAPVTPD